MKASTKARIDNAPNFDLDCGDNSCYYATKRGGMRTNGGCRCSRNNPRDVEMFLRRKLHTAMQIIEELEPDQEPERSGAW